MNITNVNITRTAEETTDNASYVLEYAVINSELQRVHVSVYEKEADETGNRPSLGIIYMEQGSIFCNIPSGKELGPLFGDFDRLMECIRKNMNQPE